MLLDQDITKEGRMNNMQLEFEPGEDNEYDVNGIQNSAVYAKQLTTSQLPGPYYLVLWKSYPEEENTWEPVSAIQHLWTLVTAYHKNNPEKSLAISLSINMVPSMARPIVASTKQNRPAGPTAAPTKKRGQSAGSTTTNKRTKKS